MSDLSNTNLSELLVSMGKLANDAAKTMRGISGAARNKSLLIMAKKLQTNRAEIAAANEKDLTAAMANNLSAPKVDRLRLTDRIIEDLIEGLNQVVALPDPIGAIEDFKILEHGLKVGKMRIPLGVVGMIFESRPNVTVEAASLAIKSGNAIILRGGSEAFYSNQVLAKLFQDALVQAGLPKHAVQLIPVTDRAAITAMCHLDSCIDVMIPRGGEQLIRLVSEQARMPVLKHDKGVCHMFVDESADLQMATKLVVNAKTQRPGVCNALETLLIHEKVAQELLPQLTAAMTNVEFRVCPKTANILQQAGLPAATPATEEDWQAEYLDLILAVKIVDDIDQAIDHIAQYSSKHTESIVTNNHEHATRFVDLVDSSLVLVNASTRFNDGFQLGLGAEIGISTSKLHAFGPMGVKELTTLKFVGYGNGNLRT